MVKIHPGPVGDVEAVRAFDEAEAGRGVRHRAIHGHAGHRAESGGRQRQLPQGPQHQGIEHALAHRQSIHFFIGHESSNLRQC